MLCGDCCLFSFLMAWKVQRIRPRVDGMMGEGMRSVSLEDGRWGGVELAACWVRGGDVFFGF